MTKKVILTRILANEKAVYGILAVIEDGLISFICRTIENRAKIFQAGVYPIRFEHSPRFNRNLWELHNIAGRGEIKIHVANYYDQLEGCIGVGNAMSHLNTDTIPDLSASGPTLATFHNKMTGINESTITVVDLF